MDDEQLKVKHSDVTYDYIKFHLGLYIATPPVIAIVAVNMVASVVIAVFGFRGQKEI